MKTKEDLFWAADSEGLLYLFTDYGVNLDEYDLTPEDRIRLNYVKEEFAYGLYWWGEVMNEFEEI